MFDNVSTAELTYVLGTLARVEEPNGVALDEHSRERLAVSIVREVKDRLDVLPERDRAELATARGIRVFQAGEIPAREFKLQLASDLLATEQEQNREPSREPFTFYRSRLVNVNGKRLKLKWAC